VGTGAARLVLEDGTVFEGVAFGADTAAAGEVVFNTGMVGYPETLTDPSYRGQILVLTYPLIGNYGVPAYSEDRRGLPVGFESPRVQAAGLVVAEHCAGGYSHHRAARSLADWLAEAGVPGIAGIDTRTLTRRLRERGTMLGKLETPKREIGFFDPNATHLVAAASPSAPARLVPEAASDERRPRVVLVDCGCKAAILRALLDRGFEVLRVPHDHYFLNEDYDGLVISNGPGDPKTCAATVRNVERALAVGRPILGICLGHQILALAAGADTYKLKFGHRGQNQPCLLQGDGPGGSSGRCHITSHNHGYAVRGESLPGDWRVWFVNANDGTVEGCRHATRPFFGVQFHPEASPGPVDTAWVFDEFASRVTGAGGVR
jgi:carbamoyl-phosphate synthase small subunit